jgi:hypothetical protein
VAVVALVAAKDRAGSVGDTVQALRGIAEVDEVVVVDDGSRDGTSDVAAAAGASVVRLPANVGKGGAVTAGLEAAPSADVYLLVDDDTGSTAALARALLGPVLTGAADMTIGVLPSAGTRGGFGTVAKVARAAIRRATGFEARTPLSGQRAVRGELLRSLAPLAPRFGLETALTIDAVRAGARVQEIAVPMEHAHTGRSLAGFRHRAGQGLDILRAVWSRLTTSRQRIAAGLLVMLLGLGWAFWSGQRWEASSEPLVDRPVDKVVLFGIPRLSLDDVGQGDTPNLDRLMDTKTMSAMSVRTFEGRPSSAEGYTALGAGARLRGRVAGGQAYAADAPLEGGTAKDATQRRTGQAAPGEVVVVGGAAMIRLNSGRNLPSEPGLLGEALHAAGKRTAVVGNADNPGSRDGAAPPVFRPAALAVMDSALSVDVGAVSRADMLRRDPTAPFGYRFDPGKVMAATERAMAEADVVVVDPGDLDRANAWRRQALDRAGEATWRAAVRRTDAMLGRIEAALPVGTLLLVVAPSPPSDGWHLMPTVATGAGLEPGGLHSPSTRRTGVVTITDVAPTVLDALGLDVPSDMIGQAFRRTAERPALGDLRTIDRDAGYRERIAYPTTLTFIVVQAIVYFGTIFILSRWGRVGRLAPALRWLVLGIAAFPLASFLLRAVPDVPELGGAGVLVLLAIDALLVTLALRARRHPLSPLAWILGLTALVIMVDTATGVRLQTSSLLGYSLHIAARFYGLGNAAFAVLAVCSLLAVAIHVQYAPRRREALVLAAGFLGVVIVVDGAPSLGDDVGGILTLVPAFGLTMLVMWGRRVSWKWVAGFAVLTVALLLVATGVDLLRPEESRSHLGRLASDVDDSGIEVFLTTAARKLSTNIRILGTSIWTWMVPIIAGLTIFLLFWQRRWAALLPARSPLRAGAVGALATALLGFATNDSGVIVTALVFVYVGPYIVLLALEHDRGQPVWMGPAASDPVRPAEPVAPAPR